MILIGIDPGKKGAYAVIDTDGGVYAKLWDDEEFVQDMFTLAPLNPVSSLCVVERVGARPGQGVSSCFSFGKSAGYIEGVLSAFSIPYELVLPQKWKKEFSLIGTDKKQSIDTARKLYPGVVLRPTDRCRIDSDGMAEALLMAEYARRKLVGRK